MWSEYHTGPGPGLTDVGGHGNFMYWPHFVRWPSWPEYYSFLLKVQMIPLPNALKGNTHAERFRKSQCLSWFLSHYSGKEDKPGLYWESVHLFLLFLLNSTDFLVATMGLVEIKLCLFLLFSAHTQAVSLSTETRNICRSLEERATPHISLFSSVLLCRPTLLLKTQDK